jgi:hypothetical protein
MKGHIVVSRKEIYRAHVLKLVLEGQLEFQPQFHGDNFTIVRQHSPVISDKADIIDFYQLPSKNL